MINKPYTNCPPPPEDIRPRCECGNLINEDMGVCDTCMAELEDIIENIMEELEIFQSKYRRLTGRDFRRPARLAERKKGGV
jgi:hypothetical protein